MTLCDAKRSGRIYIVISPVTATAAHVPKNARVKKIKIKGVLIMVLMSLLPEYVVLVNYARKFMQHDRRLL